MSDEDRPAAPETLAIRPRLDIKQDAILAQIG